MHGAPMLWYLAAFRCVGGPSGSQKENPMTRTRSVALLFLAACMVARGSSAQTPARDPSARLREVLPSNVAQRVLARIADARARQLPAAALENRALKFAAKGVAPTDIERSVNEQADRMEQARAALASDRLGGELFASKLIA